MLWWWRQQARGHQGLDSAYPPHTPPAAGVPSGRAIAHLRRAEPAVHGEDHTDLEDPARAVPGPVDRCLGPRVEPDQRRCPARNGVKRSAGWVWNRVSYSRGTGGGFGLAASAAASQINMAEQTRGCCWSPCVFAMVSLPAGQGSRIDEASDPRLEAMPDDRARCSSAVKAVPVLQPSLRSIRLFSDFPENDSSIACCIPLCPFTEQPMMRWRSRCGMAAMAAAAAGSAAGEWDAADRDGLAGRRAPRGSRPPRSTQEFVGIFCAGATHENGNGANEASNDFYGDQNTQGLFLNQTQAECTTITLPLLAAFLGSDVVGIDQLYCFSVGPPSLPRLLNY